MHTWTDTLPTGFHPSTEGWDHVTITHGLSARPVRGRTVALAVAGLGVAVVAALGLGGVLSSTDAATPETGAGSGQAAQHGHPRFGPVVPADPHAHARLGPVAHRSAEPRP